jgi:transposase
MSNRPDVTLILPLRGNCSCGECLDSITAIEYVKRQIHDLPEVKLVVTEYQAETKICPSCKKTNQACFPIEAAAQVQYGSRVHGLATYLNVAHFIPFERTSQIIGVLCGASLSDGTIDSSLKAASEKLLSFEANLKAGLQLQAVLHADETGCKVAGKLHWIHVLSCEMMTFYAHHQKRGYVALEFMGVLPNYKGTVMHDAWSTYFQLSAIHALCNAHLLRELRALAEHYQQVWASELRVALQGVYHAWKTNSLTELSKMVFIKHFDDLLDMGLVSNPIQPRGLGKRGRIAQSKGRNLALRCKQHKEAVLRFLFDTRVPFDNNLAERDIRMVCVKRKVSGGFRSVEGATAFCRIRSYISTLNKQGMNVWDGLVSVFRGAVIMPNFIC